MAKSFPKNAAHGPPDAKQVPGQHPPCQPSPQAPTNLNAPHAQSSHKATPSNHECNQPSTTGYPRSRRKDVILSTPHATAQPPRPCL